MKKIIMILLVFAGVCCFAEDKAGDNSSSSEPLEIPESLDTSNVEHMRILAKANPTRFEAHLMLATALVASGNFEESLEEFRQVDKLSSRITDRNALIKYQYEDLYALVLFVTAERRLNRDVDNLYTMRMLQQVLGMDNTKLKEKKLLSRCYMYLAQLYFKRGSYGNAAKTAEAGIDIADDEDNSDNEKVMKKLLSDAKDELKKKEKAEKLEKKKSE